MSRGVRAIWLLVGGPWVDEDEDADEEAEAEAEAEEVKEEEEVEEEEEEEGAPPLDRLDLFLALLAMMGDTCSCRFLRI